MNPRADIPRCRRSPRAIRLALALSAVMAGAAIVSGVGGASSWRAASASGQTPDPVVVFESPAPDDFVSGPTAIRIRVDPPGTALRSVSIMADGQLVCTIDRPPWECAWDAGPKIIEHTIRASVLLSTGRRIAHTVQTKPMDFAESVRVDAVWVTASVTDGHGMFVRGLPRDAFRVYEDDVRQPITSFASENIGLEVIVAVDTSGSMKEAMPIVKQAVKKFLQALRASDRVTLVVFNDRVYTLARPTSDLQARLKAVDRMAPWGGTALYDAVVRSVDQLGGEGGRRVLVLFTDGEDRDSRVPAEIAERRVESSDVVLYPIGQGRATTVASLKRVLERLADKSGGRAFFADLGELDGVFSRIIEELSHQYLLGYDRPDTAVDDRWRKIRLELPGRDLKVRARQGYRVRDK